MFQEYFIGCSFDTEKNKKDLFEKEFHNKVVKWKGKVKEKGNEELKLVIGKEIDSEADISLHLLQKRMEKSGDKIAEGRDLTFRAQIEKSKECPYVKCTLAKKDAPKENDLHTTYEEFDSIFGYNEKGNVDVCFDKLWKDKEISFFANILSFKDSSSNSGYIAEAKVRCAESIDPKYEKEDICLLISSKFQSDLPYFTKVGEESSPLSIKAVFVERKNNTHYLRLESFESENKNSTSSSSHSSSSSSSSEDTNVSAQVEEVDDFGLSKRKEREERERREREEREERERREREERERREREERERSEREEREEREREKREREEEERREREKREREEEERRERKKREEEEEERREREKREREEEERREREKREEEEERREREKREREEEERKERERREREKREREEEERKERERREREEREKREREEREKREREEREKREREEREKREREEREKRERERREREKRERENRERREREERERREREEQAAKNNQPEDDGKPHSVADLIKRYNKK